MGAFLLLCGDYRLGVAGSFKIGANEVAIGLTMPKAAIEICRDRLVPAYFNRSMLTSEIYHPEDSVSAGFLDRVVEKESLPNDALSLADEYTKLDMSAYENTKARVTEFFLKRLRAAIEDDNTSFETFFNVE
jgi:enoyl-CoA hydratase